MMSEAAARPPRQSLAYIDLAKACNENRKEEMMINVTIFNEFRHEQENTAVQAIYPDGIHAVLAAALGHLSRQYGRAGYW